MEDPDTLLGAEFAGHRIERWLGRGGMGEVYLARDLTSGQTAVIKFLAGELAANASLRARFEREGRVLQQLPPHPHVVRVHGVFDDELLDQPYIVMEFLDRGSLEELMRERGPLDPLVAARIARDVARGLELIHGQGLVHRDIKPANILLSGNGAAKIVDLGLAKEVFQSGLTRPDQLLGTIHYMAPEQWQTHKLPAACDQFALGATLYHMALGRPPFQGTEPPEIMEQVLGGQLVPPRQVDPALPPDLELVILQLLMTEPGYRYPSAAACADDLERFLQGQPLEGVPCLIDAAGRRSALIPGRSFVIGSAPEADVVLPDPAAAPRHARIRRKRKGFVLSDLRSKGGTRVNGEAVEDDPRLLRHGERIQLGPAVLEFCDPVSPSSGKP